MANRKLTSLVAAAGITTAASAQVLTFNGSATGNTDWGVSTGDAITLNVDFGGSHSPTYSSSNVTRYDGAPLFYSGQIETTGAGTVSFSGDFSNSVLLGVADESPFVDGDLNPITSSGDAFILSDQSVSSSTNEPSITLAGVRISLIGEDVFSDTGLNNVLDHLTSETGLSDYELLREIEVAIQGQESALFGVSGVSAAVPEPANAPFLVAALAFLEVLRRRQRERIATKEAQVDNDNLMTKDM